MNLPSDVHNTSKYINYYNIWLNKKNNMLFDRIFILSLQNIVALKYIKSIKDNVFNRTEM
jgi:hypothetical protein